MIYGYCPKCEAEGINRERRPNGDDICRNGHRYPSATALKQPRKESDFLSRWRNEMRDAF